MAGKKQRIRHFLLDLTSLEINTIVTENITGESMGDPRQALEWIRSSYGAKLGAIAETHSGEEDATLEIGALEVAAARGATASESMSFDGQRHMAEELMQRYKTRLSADDQNQLSRIHGQCRELERLSEKLGEAAPEAAGDVALESRAPDSSAPPATPEATELGPEDMMALRKIWELGAEPIALQTVVQASGDIITRVHPDHATPQSSMLLDLHRTGVATATEMWRSLVDTAVSILERIIDR